jgi:hypothetical protein
MQPTDGGPIKIGYSENVLRRHKQLEAHYGVPLAILASRPGDQEDERELHERFKHLRLGLTEQFQPAGDLLEFIGRPLLVGMNPEAVEAIEPDHNKVKATVVVKCRREWKEWLQNYAKHLRVNPAQFIDIALAEMAADDRFEPPPKR